ncbi:hypothetical protein [Pseudomonas sp. S5F11]|nr:hypothetical protein [Pseudomonas sp. S5F11]
MQLSIHFRAVFLYIDIENFYDDCLSNLLFGFFGSHLAVAQAQ